MIDMYDVGYTYVVSSVLKQKGTIYEDNSHEQKSFTFPKRVAPLQNTSVETYLKPCQASMVGFLGKIVNTTQKMKFSIKYFFSKCDKIRSFLQIWSQVLNKSLTENFIFYAVQQILPGNYFSKNLPHKYLAGF